MFPIVVGRDPGGKHVVEEITARRPNYRYTAPEESDYHAAALVILLIVVSRKILTRVITTGIFSHLRLQIYVLCCT